MIKEGQSNFASRYVTLETAAQESAQKLIDAFLGLDS